MTTWRRFLDGIRTRTQSLAPGEALFRAGDKTRAIFHMERGDLRLCRGAVTLHQPRPGDLFAEEGLFAPAYSCDAIALRPSVVEVFPKGAVLLHLSAHPQINLSFSAYLTGQVQVLRGRLELMRLTGAGERVMAYLTRLGAAEDVIRLDRPLIAVAEEIGLTHEALYRTLARLQRDGRLLRPGRGLFRLL